MVSFYIAVHYRKAGHADSKVATFAACCTHGFKLTKNGQTSRSSGVALRYGKGLYFTSIAGKANDYAKLTAQVWFVS